jgi:hypothetical protein
MKVDMGRMRRGIGGWIGSLGFWQKIGLLLLIVVLFYGGTIAFDNLVMRDWLTSWAGPSPDLEVYQERAKSIIDGLIPYRDFYAESPPIINYLLVPPQLLGGEGWMYALYFSTFTFLTGAFIYAFLRRFDEHLGFISGVLFILSPFAFVESTFGIQDESIVVFFFLLPPLFIVIGRVREGAAALGLGIMTKMLSVMLTPILFLGDRPLRKHLETFLVLVITILLVSLPFLIICPVEFLRFPEYYFLEVEGAVMGGMSFWHFLEMGRLKIPGEVGLIITVSTFLIATYYVLSRRIRPWQASLILVMTFFTFYPKIHLGYFLIPIGLLIVWASEDLRIFLRTLFVYVPLGLATAFSESVLGTPAIDVSWGWAAGLILSLIGLIILWDTVRISIGRDSFIDRGGIPHREAGERPLR